MKRVVRYGRTVWRARFSPGVGAVPGVATTDFGALFFTNDVRLLMSAPAD